jgi:hypothetical protein
MARALWVYILASAIAFVPDVATSQQSDAMKLAQADTRQRRPSQAQREESARSTAFSAQQRACLQDDPTACERALSYPKLTPKDRAILEAKRSGIIAVRQAAERERREAAAAERVRLEREREREAAAVRQAEILAYNLAQVPRISPVWTAVAVLAAILSVAAAMLLLFVGEARAVCMPLMAKLQRARVLRALWPTPATALVHPPMRPAPRSGNGKLPTDNAADRACGASGTATPSRDTTGAIAALELAQAYLEEVRDAEVPGYAEATLRKLHLNTLALATRQLERGKELDPDAFLEGNDAHGNPRRLGFNELKAEALLLEGLTHQANDVRRAIVALAASTLLRPDNPHAFFALGLSRAAIGQKSGAVEALRQAVAINPKSIIYRKELNRAENLTAVEVAGYRSTRVGDRIVNAEISRWTLRNLATLPRRFVRLLG